jgi:nucleoside-diphosphate-sugar epimerase
MESRVARDTDHLVLVTGGAGFIGRALVAALLAEGRRVRVLVRRADAAASLAVLGAESMVGDLLDPAAIQRAAAGVTSVFHLAGRLFAPPVPAEEYQHLHVDATVALLEACAGNRLESFVLCSTTGVHGPTGPAPAREDDPGHPQNAYETTKADAERAAIVVANRDALPLITARPGLVYGPGDRHLLGWFRSIRAGYYRVIGSGENKQHPVYIDDTVRALLLCADAAGRSKLRPYDRNRPPGRAYHLVGSRAVTMRELSDAIGTAVGRAVPRTHLPAWLAFTAGAALEALPVPRRLLPLTRSRVRFMLQNREYDGTRAREELGFVPSVNLADGLSHAVAWYRAQGLL